MVENTIFNIIRSSKGSEEKTTIPKLNDEKTRPCQPNERKEQESHLNVEPASMKISPNPSKTGDHFEKPFHIFRCKPPSLATEPPCLLYRSHFQRP